MPNPTRAQILNAHEALEELKNVALSAADFCGDTEKYLAWKSEIIAALPPLPRPTMAEVEWDDDEHYLAEAEHGTYSGVVMLSKNALSGTVRVLAKIGDINDVRTVEAVELTPTGKRYTLTEVQE